MGVPTSCGVGTVVGEFIVTKKDTSNIISVAVDRCGGGGVIVLAANGINVTLGRWGSACPLTLGINPDHPPSLYMHSMDHLVRITERHCTSRMSNTTNAVITGLFTYIYTSIGL